MFALFLIFNVFDGEIMHSSMYSSYNADITATVVLPERVAQDKRTSLYLLQNGAG